MTRLAALLVVAVAAFAACASPSSGARVAEQAPDATSFAPVALMMVQACGTLDCHGTVGRDLRLYGDTGLRYSATDVPSTLIATTSDEVAEDYASVVGLEPETMSSVVASGGQNPERLALVSKARGAQSHKGGAVIVPGDARDVCLTSWLAGHTDAGACAAALELP
jgi:hypothetical protein